MRLRFLTAVIASMALASSILGQSGGSFNLSPSTATGGGNTTANGTFSLTGAIGQSSLGAIGRSNFSITGGLFGSKARPFMYGDVNSDHVVNIRDVIAIGNFLAGNIPFDAPFFSRGACDVNLDGKINIQDLLVLANFLAGNTGLPTG